MHSAFWGRVHVHVHVLWAMPCADSLSLSLQNSILCSKRVLGSWPSCCTRRSTMQPVLAVAVGLQMGSILLSCAFSYTCRALETWIKAAPRGPGRSSSDSDAGLPAFRVRLARRVSSCTVGSSCLQHAGARANLLCAYVTTARPRNLRWRAEF